MASFQLTVNGREHHVDVPSGTSLLEELRNDIGDESAKFGCWLGQCGACVVWIDGHPTPVCDTPVGPACSLRNADCTGRRASATASPGSS